MTLPIIHFCAPVRTKDIFYPSSTGKPYSSFKAQRINYLFFFFPLPPPLSSFHPLPFLFWMDPSFSLQICSSSLCALSVVTSSLCSQASPANIPCHILAPESLSCGEKISNWSLASQRVEDLWVGVHSWSNQGPEDREDCISHFRKGNSHWRGLRQVRPRTHICYCNSSYRLISPEGQASRFYSLIIFLFQQVA